jgi:hypothetical protein
VALPYLEAQAAEPVEKLLAKLPEPSAPLWFLLRHSEGCSGGRRERWREGGGIDESTGPIDEVLDEIMGTDDEAAEAAKGFAQGSHLNDLSAIELEVLQRAAPCGSHHSRAMGIVDHQQRAGLLCGSLKLR